MNALSSRPRAAGRAPGTPAGDEAGVRALVAAFSESWNAHDAAALARLFDDDAALTSVTGRLAKGRGEIEELLATEHATLMRATTLTWTGTAIRFLGPTSAMVVGDGELDGLLDASGLALPATKLRMSAVLVNANGVWRIQPCIFDRLPSEPGETRK